MKRLTLSLPDDVAAALHQESERRNVPESEIVREAVAGYVVPSRPRRHLKIANLGASGQHDGSERIEEILAHEWGDRDPASSVATLTQSNPGLKRDRRTA